MDFNLTNVQSQLQESARDTLEKSFSSELIREAEASEEGFPRAIWKEATHLDWPKITLPEEFGGGGSLLDACVLFEEIGRAGATLPLVASSGVASTILAHSPQSAHRDRLLSGISSGNIVSPALIDEQSRNEWDEVQLPIEAVGDGFQLSGKKVFVPFASVADELLVTAVNAEGEIMIVVVEPSAEDVRIARHHTDIGVPISSVDFNNVQVPGDRVIHRGNDALTALHAGLQAGSLLATAEAVGQSEAIIQMTAKYVTERHAFGQPIGSFQAVAHPCADMRIGTDTVRILLHEAAWLVDSGRNATEEIESTKALANEFFDRTGSDAFVVHGAIGYATDYDLQLFLRRLQGFCQTLGETQESWERAALALGI